MEQLLKEILEQVRSTNWYLGELLALEKSRAGCQEKHTKEMMEQVGGIMGPFQSILERLKQQKTGGSNDH